MPEPITYADDPSSIIAHAVDLAGQSRRIALVTSVGIEGGAARALGALAVVDETGAMTGYLSNGCIDRDIQLHALEALHSGTKKLLRYGDGSQFADLTLPCGGSLSVLIDPTRDQTELIALHQALQARKAGTLRFQLPQADGHAPDAIVFEYKPKVRLVLAGRGAIFRAMAQIGHATRFEVFGLSPEVEDLAAITGLTTSPPVHLTTPQHPVDLPELDAHAAFLTLFHDHEWEPALLQAALASDAHYIGSLGSTRTHMVRKETLAGLGVAQQDTDRLHGPIGLVPSLRDAPLIAVSALAEIVASLPQRVRRISPAI
ncbi:XdhC family protein [uncultured Tateyamaria sp.]|uniref:XdhC family protein n=1 Tax=uncultured Tateyamaria sp. TaxID=455651 RepID=UPI00262232EA|nr:XdhC family protein [uncultured Tateyamaria sp.]